MTTLVLNYSSNLFEVIGKFLRGMLASLMYARQMSANLEAARYLSRYEFGGREFRRILEELNKETYKFYKDKYNA